MGGFQHLFKSIPLISDFIRSWSYAQNALVVPVRGFECSSGF